MIHTERDREETEMREMTEKDGRERERNNER